MRWHEGALASGQPPTGALEVRRPTGRHYGEGSSGKTRTKLCKGGSPWQEDSKAKLPW
jgi:hypothetical protein